MPLGWRVDSAAKQEDTLTATYRYPVHAEPLGDLRIDRLELCLLTIRPSPLLLEELLGALGLQIDRGTWDGTEHAEATVGIGVVASVSMAASSAIRHPDISSNIRLRF